MRIGTKALVVAALTTGTAGMAQSTLTYPESAGTERLAFAIVEVARGPGGLRCRFVKSSGNVEADKQACNFLQGDWKRKVGVQEWPVWVLPPKPVEYVPAVRGKTNLLKITDYPTAALAKGDMGIIVSRLVISESGALERCTVIGSSGSKRLDPAPCKAALKRFKFEPATIGGKPVRDVQLLVTSFGIPR